MQLKFHGKLSSVLLSGLLLLPVLLCSCNSTEKVPETEAVPISNIPEAELKETARQFFLDIYAGLQEGNYEKFMEHHRDEYRRKLERDGFKRLSEDFKKRNGKLKSIRFLGSVDKYYCRVFLWAAMTERTPFAKEEILKLGKDPEQIPDTESVIQLTLGKVGEEWKVISMAIY